jgi:hypothetical protein
MGSSGALHDRLGFRRYSPARWMLGSFFVLFCKNLTHIPENRENWADNWRTSSSHFQSFPSVS